MKQKLDEQFKIVCLSPTSQINPSPIELQCPKSAKIEIINAITGQQSAELCPQLTNHTNVNLKPCEETTKTTKVIKKKFETVFLNF